jgi:hypothetical protein
VTCFRSVKDITPKAYATSSAILDYIKTDENNKKQVESIRGLDGNEYIEKKLTRPCVSWTGTFSHRSNNGIIGLSDLMYFDIDDPSVSKKDVIAIPEVIAVWNSLSGKGLGFIIGTVGVNKNNFVSTYDSFSKRYDLPIDRLHDIARLNILSYDSEMLVKDGVLYRAIDPVAETENRKMIISYQDILGDEYRWENLCNRALELTYKKGLDYSVGMRHNFTVSFFTKTNFYGIPHDFALYWISKLYYLDQERIQTSIDIYERYRKDFNSLLRSSY